MAKAKEAVAVDEAAENSEVEEPELLDTEANGQGRIPGTEYKAVKALIQFGKRREDAKAEHKLITARLKDMKDNEGPALFHKYKEHFQETDTSWLYEAGGIEIEVKKGALVIETHLTGDE